MILTSLEKINSDVPTSILEIRNLETLKRIANESHSATMWNLNIPQNK